VLVLKPTITASGGNEPHSLTNKFLKNLKIKFKKIEIKKLA
jgi:hypothetical protein